MYEITFKLIISTLTRRKKFEISRIWDVTWESCSPDEKTEVLEEILIEAAKEVPKEFFTPKVHLNYPTQTSTVPQTSVTILSITTLREQ